jgi:tight adherence protein B
MSLSLAAASHQPFWSSTLALALVVGACALVVGVTVALVLSRRSGRGNVQERVGAFVSPATVSDEADSGAQRVTSRLLTRTELSLEREHRWDEFKEILDIARIGRPAIEIVYLTAGWAITGAVLLTVLLGTPIAGVAALVLIPVVARTIIKRRLSRQRILFGEQLPAHLQELAAAMRAGHSMISGIGVMAEGASEPTQGEFQRVIADEQLGMRLEDAMRTVAVRMDAKDMEQVALVAELHRQAGGNMAEVLDRVAEAVRERAELNRELRTLTAQARGSRWIVTLIPPGLLVAIDLLNPKYLKPLFDTETGHVLIGLATVLIIAGSLLMGRIVRIEA